MCGDTGKVFSHIGSECSKLAQREYKKKHDNVARIVYWKLCEKFNFEKLEKWYLHNPQTVTENVNHRLVFDMNLQCDNVIVERRLDIVIDNKVKKIAIALDVTKLGEKKIIDKEREKTAKYQNFKIEIQRLLNLKKIDAIPVALPLT